MSLGESDQEGGGKERFWEFPDFHITDNFVCEGVETRSHSKRRKEREQEHNENEEKWIHQTPPRPSRRKHSIKESSKAGDPLLQRPIEEGNENEGNPNTGGGVHPLLIDHVVEKILNYSDDFISTIKQFRLVCKQWCTIATKRYRSHYGTMVFQDDFNRNTSQFIEVMRKCKDMPFDKFKFTGGFVVYKPYNGDYQFDKIYNELFRTCVPWMKHFELSSHNPSDLHFPKDIKNYDLSHLISLSFHICVFYCNLQIEMSDYLRDILKAAVNVTSLDLRLVPIDPSSLSEDQVAVLEKFGNVLCSSIPQSCRNLKLNMCLSENHMDLLEKRRLQLEQLIIDFQKSRLNTKAIESFLKSQSETLQTLELIEAPIHREMELPMMKNLSFLKIEGKPRIPSFDFDAALPKLRRLEIMFYWIYQEDEDWLKDVFLDCGKSKTVTDLELLCEINKEVFIFPRIIKTFPKLRRLSVVLNASIALATLFKKMSFLEELEISLAREFWGSRGQERMGKVDEIFSGLPAHLCIQLLDKNDFQCTDIPETLSEPSLRDLKNLRKLKLRAFRADQIPFSDVSVYYGLMKMEKLTHVILDVFPISKPCLEVLRGHLKSLQLLPGPPTLSPDHD